MRIHALRRVWMAAPGIHDDLCQGVEGAAPSAPVLDCHTPGAHDAETQIPARYGPRLEPKSTRESW
jgi:hypothetical protein